MVGAHRESATQSATTSRLSQTDSHVERQRGDATRTSSDGLLMVSQRNPWLPNALAKLRGNHIRVCGAAANNLIAPSAASAFVRSLPGRELPFIPRTMCAPHWNARWPDRGLRALGGHPRAESMDFDITVAEQRRRDPAIASGPARTMTRASSPVPTSVHFSVANATRAPK